MRFEFSEEFKAKVRRVRRASRELLRVLLLASGLLILLILATLDEKEVVAKVLANSTLAAKMNVASFELSLMLFGFVLLLFALRIGDELRKEKGGDPHEA